MASISAPGSGSGIDVGSLVAQLIAAESEPVLARLGQRESKFQAQFSAIGLLKSALASFTATLGALKKTQTFETRTASSSDEFVFTASATAQAVPGSFDIEVLQLAQAQKLSSTGFAASTDPVGSGTISITSGSSGFSVVIPSSASSLAEVRDAINKAPGNPGVAATLITVDAGGGGTETRLSLTAPGTGSANGLTITVDDDDGNDVDAAGLSRLVFDPAGSGVQNLTETAAATDAQVLIDNQLRSASSNRIDAAIQGVTLDLVAAQPGVTHRLTIALDRSTVVNAVKEFISQHNGLRQTIGLLTAFDAATQTAGILLGDAGVRGISSVLQRELGTSLEGISESFGSLVEIGITTNRDGTLSLNEGKLDDAMSADLAGVQALFGSDEGIATRLQERLGGFVESQGILDLRSSSITSRIDDINSQREALARRMSDREESLLAQFTAMDALVAQLQSTSNFLNQQLTALSSLATRRSSR